MESIEWLLLSSESNKFAIIGLLLFLAFLIYLFLLLVFRLFFSPLACFPGPKLAAATGCVEFYHDYFKQGAYIYEIEKMHQKYGAGKLTLQVLEKYH